MLEAISVVVIFIIAALVSVYFIRVLSWDIDDADISFSEWEIKTVMEKAEVTMPIAVEYLLKCDGDVFSAILAASYDRKKND